MPMYFMTGQHPPGPFPHEVMARMLNPDQPSAPYSADDPDNNGRRRGHGCRRRGPHPHHRGRGHPGFGPEFHHPFEHFGRHESPNGHPHFHGHRRGMNRPPFRPAAFGLDFLQRFASEMGNGFEDLFTTDRDADDVNDSQIDLVPRADVFDTATEYVVHVSLPGAKKSDISIDYNAQESSVHLAGVIHRPDFNEELHEAITLDERGREVGVFERSIKLSTRDGQSANVDQDKISAKLVDGVLIVRLPKAEEQGQRDTNKKVIIHDDEDLDETAPREKKAEESTTQDEKHASVVEIQDELDSMHVDSETEAGDLLQEADEKVYTPSHTSEEGDDDAGEYVKVDSK